jgi:LysM domain-containing protein
MAARPRHRRPDSPIPALLLPVCLLAGASLVLAGSTGSLGAVPTPTPTPAPTGPTPKPSFVRPTPTPAPTFLVYTVATGDSLNTIAKKFGTTARSIAFWNRGTYPSLDPESAGYRPNTVRIGWTLMIIPHVIFDEESLPAPS